MHTPMSLQDARKLAKEGWRKYTEVHTGSQDWWTNPERAREIRRSVNDRAKAVLALQQGDSLPEKETTQMSHEQAQEQVREMPPVPPVEKRETRSAESPELQALRAQAWERFPRIVPERIEGEDEAAWKVRVTKVNKVQAQARRAYLVANGAPAGKVPSVVFGKKTGA